MFPASKALKPIVGHGSYSTSPVTLGKKNSKDRYTAHLKKDSDQDLSSIRKELASTKKELTSTKKKLANMENTVEELTNVKNSVKQLHADYADLNAKFIHNSQDQTKNYVEITKKVNKHEGKLENQDEKINVHAGNLEELSKVQEKREGTYKLFEKNIADLEQSNEEINKTNEENRLALTEMHKKIEETPANILKSSGFTERVKVVLPLVLSQPEVIAETMKHIDYEKFTDNKELSAELKEAENKPGFKELGKELVKIGADKINAALDDIDFKNLAADLITKGLDKKFIQDVISKLQDKFSISSITAAIITFVLVLTAVIVLYILLARHDLKNHAVPFNDRFLNIDPNKIPPEMQEIVKADKKLYKETSEHQGVVSSMNNPREMAKQLNPLTSNANWVDKGIGYANDPKNKKFMDELKQSKDKSLYKKIINLVEKGVVSVAAMDIETATNGIIAQQMRLNKKVEKLETKIIDLGSSYRSKRKEIKEKFISVLDDAVKSKKIFEENKNDLKAQFKEIEGKPSKNLFELQAKNEQLNELLEKVTAYVEAQVPDGNDWCTIM